MVFPIISNSNQKDPWVSIENLNAIKLFRGRLKKQVPRNFLDGKEFCGKEKFRVEVVYKLNVKSEN